MVTMERMRVLSPVVEVDVKKRTLVPRLNALNGKTIGLFDNGKPNNDVFQERIGQLLQEQFPDIKLVSKLRVVGNRAHREVSEEMCNDLARRCDAVLVSMSD